MKRSERHNPTDEFLEPGEDTIVVLEGVVAGFTRWSGLGGILGILVALSVSRLFNLGFLLGAIAIVAVVTSVFVLVYFVAGRPLAQRNDPQLQSPYLTLHLTDRRVLLFDRQLSAATPTLVEVTDVNEISTVQYGSAGALVPQRVGFVIRGTLHREYEFPRSQPVGEFIDHFA